MFEIVVMFNIVGGSGHPYTQEVKYVADDFNIGVNAEDHYYFHVKYKGKSSEIVVSKAYYVAHTINQVGEFSAPSSNSIESREVDESSPSS